MTHHDRFRRIERARPDGPPASESADRARIAAVIDASPPSVPQGARQIEIAPGEPAGSGAPLDPTARSATLADEPAPGGAVDLSIDTAAVEGQPFVRCVRCGCDSEIHADACRNCEAPLDTVEQQRFNEKLWGDRRLESERERAALTQMAEARAEVRRSTARPLPEEGIVPPELGEPISDEEGPILFALLAALGVTRHKWAVAAAALFFPLFLAALGGPILSKLGWALCVLVLASLVPRRVARSMLDALSGLLRR